MKRFSSLFRVFVVLQIILFSSQISAQNWERLDHKYHRKFEKGKYDKALEQAQGLLEFSNLYLDSSDARLPLSHYYVASTYQAKGEPGKARPFVEDAYILMRPNIAFDNQMAEVLRLYGVIETELGYHMPAEELLNASLDITLELDGVESQACVSCLYALAGLEMVRAQWQTMSDILIEAFQIHERNSPLNDDYALYTNYLGLIFMNSGQMPEASLYFTKSLSAYGKKGLKEDLGCANAHNNLGLLYYQQSDYENAKLHYEKAFSLYRKLSLGYSENYMMLLSNRATLENSMANQRGIKKSSKKLAAYMESYPGRTDLPYIQGMENLAGIYASSGDPLKAEPWYLLIIEAYDSLDQPEKATFYRELLIYDD